MNFIEIKNLLLEKVGPEAILGEQNVEIQPQLVINQSKLLEVCIELQNNSSLYFDFLSCITGIDNGPKAGTMEVIYHLYSIPFDHKISLRVELKRTLENEKLPSIPTVSHIWRTAIWHEREIFDLLGINFENHPDQRRILLPEDWVGFPLRKDYKELDYYHGIKVEY